MTTQDLPKTETLDAAADVEVLKDCPDGTGVRRFAMLANTGAPVDRSYGKFIIDLSGIEVREKIPMLVDHDGSKIAGYADKMTFTDRGLELEGCLSSVTEFGKTVAGLSDEGFPWQASVGIEVLEREQVNAGETCEVNGMQLEGPISIARHCRMAETSFLYSGADSATYAVALSSSTDDKEALVADDTAGETPNVKEELAAFRAEFPGNEELATQAFLADKSVVDLKLELAAKDKEELAKANERIGELQAELADALEQLATIKSLEAQAGSPGVGFSGQARQAGNVESLSAPLPKTPKEAYERSVRLQAEFPTLAAYEALCRREGFNPKDGE